jgi:hypothetical protein
LASLKELISAYRQCRDEEQRERLFPAIAEVAQALKLLPAIQSGASDDKQV